MTARKSSIPTTVEFLNAYNVITQMADGEADPRRVKLFRTASKHLLAAAQIRANSGTRQKVMQRHRWAIANVQKAMFLRGGAP